MSDIVDQLRNPRLAGSVSLMEDAADEIERLRDLEKRIEKLEREVALLKQYEAKDNRRR